MALMVNDEVVNDTEQDGVLGYGDQGAVTEALHEEIRRLKELCAERTVTLQDANKKESAVVVKRMLVVNDELVPTKMIKDDRVHAHTIRPPRVY